ncbi:MAG: S8 family serine peptidase [Halobacteriovoraceae bacterium]|jgi:subtilisin family serine protease|nr:S8 family serine peptidase [Halobacteriovoraceae bacterium]
MKGLVAALLLFFSSQTFANFSPGVIDIFDHPTEIIVKFKASPNDFKADFYQFLQNQKAMQSFSTEVLNEETKVALFKLPIGLVASTLIQELQNSPQIEWAEPNRVIVGDPREFTPNDPLLEKQFHHQIMKSFEGWEQSTGKEEIIIAATDDGFALGHQDLKNIFWTNKGEIADNQIDDDGNGYVDDVYGWDFANNDNDPSTNGGGGSHGTHVAGILGAEFNNGVGISGHGDKIRVMALKWYGGGSWTAATVLKTYKYAADNGAKIISTSYNIDGFAGNKTYDEAVSYCYKKGILIFNSAGNGNRQQSPRSKIDKIFLVASTQSGKDRKKWDVRSRFSNYGYGVDIAAPGNPIYSTVPRNRYSDMSGTSMAAPNAAGLAGLIWSTHPEWSMAQVISQLFQASDDIDGLNSRYAGELGAGRINVKSAQNEKRLPPRIRKSWYADGTKELSFQIWGVLDARKFTRGSVVLENTKGEKVEGTLEAKGSYFLGTNVLKYQVKAAAGTYRARLIAAKLADPFGQELDGDGNGQSGDDYTLEFTVE